MRSFRYPRDEGRVIDATRRRRTAGAGLCVGSALGGTAASAIGLPVATALFGAAVPVLAVQVWREHRLLRRYRHRVAADAPARETAQ